MRIDLDTLQAVLAVAESASYTRAAQNLHITQPAVSRRLVALEQQLRTKLFRRDGYRFLPTEAGLAVCDRARQVLALVDNIEGSVQEIAGQPSGALAVGVPSALGEVLLPTASVRCSLRGPACAARPTPRRSVSRTSRNP